MENLDREIYNVYCDESCHLEKDKSNYMVVGAVYNLEHNTSRIVKDIKLIKKKHGYPPNYEIKWTKLRKSNLDLALSLIDYFFNNDCLFFRGYIIDKTGLEHKKFNQTHNEWYYKIFFRTLELLVDRFYYMNIFLDKKDTISNLSEEKLKIMLNYHARKIDAPGIKKIQSIQSHESQILQITDLLIGAIRYENEGLITSKTKEKVIDTIKKGSNLTLKHNTSRSKIKFNLFKWNRERR